VEHTLNGTKVTLATNTYDNFGRLSTKTLHGSATNQLTYAYNIRNWLTGINSTRFTQNLYYNTGNGTACYNGNISSMTWKAGSESTIRGYKFSYDALSRLTNAVYGEGTAINSNANRFSENITNYDKNGNILALQRYGQTGASTYAPIDNLTFTLNGNQLNRVDDATSASAYNGGLEFKNGASTTAEYTYDENGNLTKDLNKNITDIQYNYLNLPSKITFTDGSTITYLYGADGTKLRTVHKIGSTTTTTDFCNDVIYENGTAKMLLTEEGYVSLSDGKYHYYLKDHQGNNRVVVDQSGNVEETNHYYPFGGIFASTGNVQPYKYNGKEFDSKKSLNWYDYGARMYDPALGRFTTMDPMAEKYYSEGSYRYCLNNPMIFIDPTGKDVVTLDRESRRNILNTLSRTERRYIRFDKVGMLNTSLLNEAKNISKNFMALKALANSETAYKFIVSDKDVEGESFRNGNSNFYKGLTAFPEAENKPSKDQGVWIYVSSLESEATQAETTAHEGYGHAYFYELHKKDKSIDYQHRYINELGKPEWDKELNMYITPLIRVDSNVMLKKQIEAAVNQTKKNYKDERDE